MTRSHEENVPRASKILHKDPQVVHSSQFPSGDLTVMNSSEPIVCWRLRTVKSVRFPVTPGGKLILEETTEVSDTILLSSSMVQRRAEEKSERKALIFIVHMRNEKHERNMNTHCLPNITPFCPPQRTPTLCSVLRIFQDWISDQT